MATLFLISILLAAGVAAVAVCYWGERLFGDRALGAVLLAIFAAMLGLGLEHFVAIPQPLLFLAALALGAYGIWLLKTEYAHSLRPGPDPGGRVLSVSAGLALGLSQHQPIVRTGH